MEQPTEIRIEQIASSPTPNLLPRESHIRDDGEAAADKTIHKAFAWSITLLLVFLAAKFNGPESLFKKYRVFISVFFVTFLVYVRAYVAMGLRQLDPAAQKCSIVRCALIVAGFACCGLLLFIIVPVVDFIVISILTVLSAVPLSWYKKMFDMVAGGTRHMWGCVSRWFRNRFSLTAAEATK